MSDSLEWSISTTRDPKLVAWKKDTLMVLTLKIPLGTIVLGFGPPFHSDHYAETMSLGRGYDNYLFRGPDIICFETTSVKLLIPKAHPCFEQLHWDLRNMDKVDSPVAYCC